MEKIKLLIWFLIFTLLFPGIVSSGMGSALAKSKKQSPSIAESVAKAPSILPKLDFLDSASSGPENDPFPEIKVALDPDANVDVTFDLQVSGTALATDFTLNQTTVIIPQGETLANVDLEIIDNTKVEENKTIIFTLTSPVNAEVGTRNVHTYTILEDDLLPETSLITNPALPDGENNWFVSTPKISLTSSETGETYYQWNKHLKGKWKEYSSPIKALEGIDTLYYYSKDQDGNLEDIKHTTIKVDTASPQMPQVKQDSQNYQVNLSWEKVKGATSYEVWQIWPRKKLLKTVDSLNFTDTSVNPGQSYQYKIRAKDEAGNYSKFFLISAITPAIQIVEETPPVYEEVAVKTITPSIGNGIRTSRSVTPQVSAAQDEKKEEARTEEKKEEEESSSEGKDWNRLLLAISVLIIAAGAAIGGYYGYEWYLAKKEIPKEKPKSKNRW